MKAVDKYLVAAANAIETTGIARGGRIKKAYKGAVSSFGASLVMSGLVPTIQFFMAETNNRDADHKTIIEAIARTLYADGRTNAEVLKTQIMNLLKKQNHAERRVSIAKMKMQIMDAAVALKIMMRSYEFSDGEGMD